MVFDQSLRVELWKTHFWHGVQGSRYEQHLIEIWVSRKDCECFETVREIYTNTFQMRINIMRYYILENTKNRYLGGANGAIATGAAQRNASKSAAAGKAYFKLLKVMLKLHSPVGKQLLRGLKPRPLCLLTTSVFTRNSESQNSNWWML